MTAADLVIVDLADEVEALLERAALAEAYHQEATELVERLADARRELERCYRLIARLREALARDEAAGGVAT